MSFPPARSRAGLVTACQQVLALGVVLAALTPAAGVVSLTVVDGEHSASADVARAAATPGGSGSGTVDAPTAAVAADVEEIQLTAPAGARVAPGSLAVRPQRAGEGSAAVQTPAVPVDGFGTVGVTWSPDSDVDPTRIDVEVRTRQAGQWSGWTRIEDDADHGPDLAGTEAAGARPGTDALLVGDVDDVQVRVETPTTPPSDLRLAVIEPGTAVETRTEAPAVAADPTVDQDTSTSGDLALQAAAPGAFDAPRPEIFTRAQWGADERLRDPGSLRYGSISAGFVHHTVTSNGYSRSDVPGIMRSIYAYHTQSRGWSDIGYNFLVDRFGRIWEGRYGGVDRAVVGAHTLGYNDYAFAMSAIGNYDITGPSAATLKAYGALFAWKLGLAGVDASATRQRVGSGSFQAVSGHRDAGQTACPGRYLYAELAQIRTLAADAQGESAPPTTSGPVVRSSDLVGDDFPDVVLERRSDDQAVIIPTGGLSALGRVRAVTGSWSRWSTLSATPDLSGDGEADLVARRADGTTAIARGTGAGTFAPPAEAAGAPTQRYDLVVAAGDVDGDDRADLLARRSGTTRLHVFSGTGRGSFATPVLAGRGWSRYEEVLALGDVTGDGDPDLLARGRDGTASLRAGTRGSGFAAPAEATGPWSPEDDLSAIGDFTGDGRPDLAWRPADTGSAYVVPGRGAGVFGRGLGPVARLAVGDDLTGGIQVGGGPAPDVLARRGGDLVWAANPGTTETLAPIETGLDLSSVGVLVNVGDWDVDGDGDLVTRSRGTLYLHRGDGTGHFAARRALATGFLRVRGIEAAGDVTGDGRPDLVGTPKGGRRTVYPGQGLDGLGTAFAAGSLADPRDGVDLTAYRWVVTVEDLVGQGPADLLARDDQGLLWRLAVGRKGVVGDPRLLTEDAGPYGRAG